MSIIDDIFSKLEQKQKIQQITDSYQPENLEETLHDAIINRFKDIQENIELGFFHIQEAHEIINLDKIPSEKSYPSINLDIYSKILIEFAKKIDYITNSFEELKKISEEKNIQAQKSIKEFSTIMKQQGFKYTPGESVSDFIKNNTKTGKYQKITLEERTRTEEVVDMTKNLIEEYARLKNRHTQILSPIKATRDSIYDMAKNLDLIKEIQLDSSNKDIPSEEIDSLLIDLIYESINRTRVNKEISKLKEAKLNYNAPTKEKKDKTSSTNNIQDRVETAPIIIDTESFHYFGINGATLKNISESKEKYESAKYFLSSLETIFYDAGLDEKQIAALVSKNPHLLFESKSKMTQHLNLIERLYDLINPLKVSGIQPTLNSEIYTSEDSLNKIIKKEESKSKKINILNIELIDDDKDRQTFENRMNCINTRDERIQKYISRKAGTKTILYEKYSSEFGEGTYMKGKLGKDGRRVIYKIEPTENTINIRIINYFKNHDQHMDFFKPR